ncbi:MAG: invasion associated locus B family protein [Pseudomonadota bacterium]|nr:invasion associated locus B family protein [Pseudomonadota bacterium]
MLFNLGKIFIFFFIVVGFAYPVEKRWIKKGQFNDWEVYVKTDNSICYMISKPQKMEGAYSTRGRVDAVIAVKNELKNKYYVAFDFGYPFYKNTKVKLTIDQEIAFQIDTFAETAWINSIEYPELNLKIIKEMKKGKVLIAHGKSSRGTVTKDTYSLIGFTKAFKKVKDACS